MDTVRLALEAAWEVLYTGLVLGAGLPIVFALGVRLLSGPATAPAAEGEVLAVSAHRPSPAARLAAALCFAVVAYGVVVGLLVIIGAGQGKEVHLFDHVYPTLVDKA